MPKREREREWETLRKRVVQKKIVTLINFIVHPLNIAHSYKVTILGDNFFPIRRRRRCIFGNNYFLTDGLQLVTI